MTNEEIKEKMIELAQKLNYSYKDISHLTRAMCCRSISSSKQNNLTTENYATLGDAVLKLVLTEYFFDKGYDKAKITTSRENIEKNSKLFELCKSYGIFSYAHTASHFSGDAPLHNQLPHSKHDNYVEAIIAAIYKDKGLDYCKNWIFFFFNVT